MITVIEEEIPIPKAGEVRVRVQAAGVCLADIHRLTGDGVDAVFDAIGGDNLWRSRDGSGRIGILQPVLARSVGLNHGGSTSYNQVSRLPRHVDQ